eukprot:jgi/Chlat1/2670/Chrsp18S02983
MMVMSDTGIATLVLEAATAAAAAAMASQLTDEEDDEQQSADNEYEVEDLFYITNVRACKQFWWATCNACTENGVSIPADKKGHTKSHKRDMLRHLASGCRFTEAAVRKWAQQEVADKNKKENKSRKRARQEVTNSNNHRISSGYSYADKPMSGQEKKQLEFLLLKATISANLPFLWVNDYWVMKLLEFLRPSISVTDRKQLAGRVLKAVHEHVLAATKASCEAAYGVTIICDSWTNIKREQLFGISLITDRGEVIFRRAENVTGIKEDGPYIISQLKEEVKYVKTVLKCQALAVVTDDAAPCNWARRKLHEERNDIMVMACHAHQVNLLVGDYFKKLKGTRFVDAMKRAVDVINWFNNHSVPHAWLLDKLISLGTDAKALLLPVATRWGSQVDSLVRLLEVKNAMRALCLERYDDLLGSISKQRATQDKAKEVISWVEDSRFWQTIEQVVRHLMPLKVVGRQFEATDCRLDNVLLGYGRLSLHFQEIENARVKGVLVDILESRWHKMDQQLYLLMYVLHPAKRMKHLNQDEPIAYPIHLSDLAFHLYDELFTDGDADNIITQASTISAYMADSAPFNTPSTKAFLTRPDCDPIAFWSLMKPLIKELARLALHLYAMRTHVADQERVWSALGVVHSKLRNRLAWEKAVNITQIKSHLRSVQMEGQEKRQRGLSAVAVQTQVQYLSLQSDAVVTHPRSTASTNNAVIVEEGNTVADEHAVNILVANEDPISSASEWEELVASWMQTLDNERHNDGLADDDVPFVEREVVEKCVLGRLFLYKGNAALPFLSIYDLAF